MESNTGILLVNDETGEVIDKAGEGDKVKITRKDALERLNNTEALNYDSFHMANNNELKLIFKELSPTEKAFLSTLALYMNYNDCCLKYDNGRDISPEDLPELVGMSRKTVYATIASLLKKDIIYKGRNSRNVQIYLNPWLYCKGNRYNKVLKSMFKNYRVRSKGNIRWGDLKS